MVLAQLGRDARRSVDEEAGLQSDQENQEDCREVWRAVTYHRRLQEEGPLPSENDERVDATDA